MNYRPLRGQGWGGPQGLSSFFFFLAKKEKALAKRKKPFHALVKKKVYEKIRSRTRC